MAMKWAYTHAKEELEEKGLIIGEEIFKIIRKIEKNLEITVEDVEAVLGRKPTEKEVKEFVREKRSKEN